MTQLVVQFVVLSAVIVVAGTVLTRSADAIAEISGWGRLVVGSVLLAGATSLPELSVDLAAVQLDLPNLAIGDLLGSSLMNLGILAVLDLTYRSRGKMLSRAAAAHAMGGTVVIALTAMVGAALLVAPLTPNATLLGAHLSLWLVVLGYVGGLRLIYLDQHVGVPEAASEASEPATPRGSIQPHIWAYVAAAAAILVTGPRLATAAGDIAERSGLGNSFVGTTFVALTTSLPEMVAAITALRLGAFDLIVGNVFGSNAFNMILFLPLDVAFPGTLLSAASPAHFISVFAAILATSVVVMGQLYQQESRWRVLDPDAWLVILIITGARALVYQFS